MANRQKRILSIILCIAMFFSIGIIGFAATNWINVHDVPANVTGVTIQLSSEGVPYSLTCEKVGGNWRAPDNRLYLTDSIISITLTRSGGSDILSTVLTGTPYLGSEEYYAELGTEGGGTLNIWIKANPNYVVPTYGVTYSYLAASGTLPAAISTTSGAYVVSDTTTYPAGASVDLVSTAPVVGTEYPVADGKWTLTSWSTHPVSMTSAGVSFTGTWTFTATPTYGVTYSYVAASGTLPAGISSTSGAYAVSDTATYPAGAAVDLVSTAPVVGTEYPVADGKWTLTSWSEHPVSMTTTGVNFVGTWTFSATPAYGVTYSYVAASGTLPAGISTTSGTYAVSDTSTYSAGVSVDLVSTAPVVGTEYTVADGKWTLTSWSEHPVTMTSVGVVFIGTWTFTANPTYSVTYNYIAASGTLPVEISTTSGTYAVSDTTTYPAGASVNLVSTAPAVGAEYFVADGKWTLTNWSEHPVTMTTTGVAFVGTWTFTTSSQPSITVTKTPLTPSVTAPGGTVIYKVDIFNASSPESEESTESIANTVWITDLTDAIGGGTEFSLDGLIYDNPGLTGSAVELPLSIAPGQTKTVYFSGPVNGSAGTTVSDVVTTSGYTSNETPVFASATASVAITAPGTPPPPPTPPAPPAPEPTPDVGVLGEQDIEAPAPVPEPSPEPVPEEAPAVLAESDKLPQTGGISFSTLLGFAGIALICGGMIAVLTKKRKEQ